MTNLATFEDIGRVIAREQIPHNLAFEEPIHTTEVVSGDESTVWPCPDGVWCYFTESLKWLDPFHGFEHKEYYEKWTSPKRPFLGRYWLDGWNANNKYWYAVGEVSLLKPLHLALETVTRYIPDTYELL